MNMPDTFIVESIVRSKGAMIVTAKDSDESKKKRRTFSELVTDGRSFNVGDRVTVSLKLAD